MLFHLKAMEIVSEDNVNSILLDVETFELVSTKVVRVELVPSIIVGGASSISDVLEQTGNV